MLSQFEISLATMHTKKIQWTRWKLKSSCVPCVSLVCIVAKFKPKHKISFDSDTKITIQISHGQLSNIPAARFVSDFVRMPLIAQNLFQKSEVEVKNR